MREYFIPACGGAAIEMAEGETVTVIDVEGGQVADFFAERAGDPDEFRQLPSTATNPCGSI